VQPDKSYVCAIDNVDAEIIEDNGGSLKVKLTNPTKAEANVRLFVESSKQASMPLGENVLKGAEIVSLKPGESREIKLEK
jgi:hypothetical protein